MILNVLAAIPAQMSPLFGWGAFFGGIAALLGIFKYFSWRISK